MSFVNYFSQIHEQGNFSVVETAQRRSFSALVTVVPVVLDVMSKAKAASVKVKMKATIVVLLFTVFSVKANQYLESLYCQDFEQVEDRCQSNGKDDG